MRTCARLRVREKERIPIYKYYFTKLHSKSLFYKISIIFPREKLSIQVYNRYRRKFVWRVRKFRDLARRRKYSRTNIEIKRTSKLKNWVKPDEEYIANEIRSNDIKRIAKETIKILVICQCDKLMYLSIKEFYSSFSGWKSIGALNEIKNQFVGK